MREPRGEITAMGTLVLAILLFIGLGFVWFYTGGPERTSSHSGPFLSLPWPFSTTSSYSFPGFLDLGTAGDDGGVGGAGSGSEEPVAPAPTFESRFGLGTIKADSPYARDVVLDVASARQSDPKLEYVTLRTAYGIKRNITVTGWTLVGSSGVRLKIGDGAIIPFLGQVNVEGPITIGGGTSIHLVSSRSPNGTSFRVNKCTGYFNQFQTFAPPLYEECPSPQSEFDRIQDVSQFNDACFTVVGGLNRCRLSITSLPGNIGSACQRFIVNTLSYNGCITDHKGDPDFYRNEWRVYLNRDQEVWKNTREEIRLLDENGKTVYVASY